MKQVILLTTAVFFIAVCNTQTPGKTAVRDARDKYANKELSYDTTTMLPEGTAFNKGKVVLLKGYKTVYLDSNKIVVVQRKNGETSGAFKCRCETGAGYCGIISDGETLRCLEVNGCKCTMDIVVDKGNNVAITQSNGNWKKLILPTANTNHQKAEDPDQGGEVIKNRSNVLPAKQ